MGHLKTTLVEPSDRQSTSAPVAKIPSRFSSYCGLQECEGIFAPGCAIMVILRDYTRVFFGKETSFPVSPKPLTLHNTLQYYYDTSTFYFTLFLILPVYEELLLLFKFPRVLAARLFEQGSQAPIF